MASKTNYNSGSSSINSNVDVIIKSKSNITNNSNSSSSHNHKHHISNNNNDNGNNTRTTTSHINSNLLSHIFCTVPMHGKESSIAVWHSINAMIDAQLNEGTEYCWMLDDDVVDAH